MRAAIVSTSASPSSSLNNHRVRWFVYRISCFLLRCLLLPFVKIHVLHRAASARPGAWLLVSNHISHFDPPLLSLAARRHIDWMAMRELFENEIFAAWLKAIGTFSTERGKTDRAAVRTALERLRTGRVVGIFPEGGIRDGAGSILQGAPLKRGASRLAQMVSAPIIPCVILGTDRLYNHRRWKPFRRIPVWIGFGDAIAADAVNETVLASAIQALCHDVCEAFQLQPDDLPKPPRERMRES